MFSAKGINKTNAGLSVAALLGAVHVLWVLIVALAPNTAQRMVSSSLELHFINVAASVTAFSPVRGLVVIVMACVFGFIAGWFVTAVYNELND